MANDRNYTPASGLADFRDAVGAGDLASHGTAQDVAKQGAGLAAAADYYQKLFGVKSVSKRLPDFPWDTISDARALATSHPDGLIDLSVGTPVDATPDIAQQALVAASNAPGYPTTWGTSALRASIIGYLTRRWHSVPLADENVLPVIGTKEVVASLAATLGLGSNDAVVIPETAYPTYEVGARLVGATAIFADRPGMVTHRPKLIWLNSPANPHGAIMTLNQLREWVVYAREVGAILAGDECYGEFVWDGEAISLLDPRVNDGSLDNIVVLHSLSKRSNVAGYRAGFVAGDATVIKELLEVRKHSGMMVPMPVQQAMVVLLDDQSHVDEQVARYRRRREILAPALVAAGFQIDDSQGSLYLWASHNETSRESLYRLARLGILVAPGDFYGEKGNRHVRVALTATDAQISAAAVRLTSSNPVDC